MNVVAPEIKVTNVVPEIEVTNELSINGFNPPKQLEAGTLFVLQSKGSWLHCGYHLTTAIVAPALLSLPFALSLLGWAGGMVWLSMAAVVTFYSYNLLSIVLDHHTKLGKRQLRFKDMARDILGPGWGRYFVGPLQLGKCYGSVIFSILLGGHSLKFIYLLCSPNGRMQLSRFITIFGSGVLLLSQMPSFHSLRHINLMSLLLCLAYSAFTVAACIYIGESNHAPPKNYSIAPKGVNRLFGIFSAISIIASQYGNGILPEIQATLAPPVVGKMFKGLVVCYSVVISTFYGVGVTGYWTFGNLSKGTILRNIMVDSKSLAPKWLLFVINIFILVQVLAISVTYLQPTNVILENKFSDPKKGQFSARNVLPRLVFRSLSVVVATLMAAMLPFFEDIMALFGAFTVFPLDFILPMVFYYKTFKPSKKSRIFWVNALIAGVSTVLSLIGAVSSVRQIALDAKNYRLFANV